MQLVAGTPETIQSLLMNHSLGLIRLQLGQEETDKITAYLALIRLGQPLMDRYHNDARPAENLSSKLLKTGN